MATPVYLLRIRDLDEQPLVDTGSVRVHATSDLAKGAIVLVVAQLPAPATELPPVRMALRVTNIRSVRDPRGVLVTEILGAAVWPLAKPFILRDVLESLDSYLGPCPIARLTNVDAQTILRGGWLGALTPPAAPIPLDGPVSVLFHRLWTTASYQQDYDKALWNSLVGLLAERGIRV